MAEEPDQNAQAIIEDLWARIATRLTQISSPPEGWAYENLSSSLQSTLTNADSTYADVQSAVSQISEANGGKLLRISSDGTIGVPTPQNDTDATPRSWVEDHVTQELANYSVEAGLVTSVNGKTGKVTLGHSDVGARPADVKIPQEDIEGLVAELDKKATTEALGTLNEGIDQRITDGVATGTYTIKNDLTSLANRVGSNETAISSIERKPAGGWGTGDLTDDIRSRINEVGSASPSPTSSTLVRRNSNGTFEVGNPTNSAHPTPRRYVDNLLDEKADKDTVDTLTTTVRDKADTSDLNTLEGTVSGIDGRVTTVESELAKKIELENGKLSEGYIPDLPVSRITGLQNSLSSKPTLTNGRVSVDVIPEGIPQSSISGLAASFQGKADLEGGKLATSQLPAIATHETYPVASRNAMLALTREQVQIGDVAIITTAGNDQGTYTLIDPDPSRGSSWLRHQAPQDAVLSVNGQHGTVNLTASDVGARALGGNIVQGDVTGLTAALNDRATKVYVDAELAKKTTPSDVADITASIAGNKMPVDLVATNNQVTLSGLRSVDGQLLKGGQRVLLTAQQASSNNGIWVVGTGEWTRASDMAQGSRLLPGTTVVVSHGAEHAQSIWQVSSTNLVTVGESGHQWTKTYSGRDQIEYRAGNGLTLEDDLFSIRLGASSGLISDSAGLRLDPSSAVRKVSMEVPNGSTINTITHNLGTTDVSLTFIDNASNEMVLVPWVVVNADTISFEFANAPARGAFRCVIIG